MIDAADGVAIFLRALKHVGASRGNDRMPKLGKRVFMDLLHIAWRMPRYNNSYSARAMISSMVGLFLTGGEPK
eukprot:2109529-Pyramimonas_sp.AAC.1